MLIDHEKVTTFRFHLTIYSGQELKNLLQQAGFAQVQLFGDLSGNDYGINAQRLIAIVQKSNDD
jgi:hypothetical protein